MKRDALSDAPLVEVGVVPDVFASGLAEVEDIGGGNLRFILFAVQKPIGGNRPAERVVVARIVMPVEAVPAAVSKALAAAGAQAVQKRAGCH